MEPTRPRPVRSWPPGRAAHSETLARTGTVKMPRLQVVAVIATLSGLLGTTVSGARMSQQSLGPKATGPVLQFDDYSVTEEFRGVPAPVLLRSARYGRTFRTRLREGARSGPNFAGTFSIVIWGCGAPCQMVAVVDARSGQLSRQLLQTSSGVEYRANSRLILADPVRPDDPPNWKCAACGTPAAYLWTGTEFEPLGRGPHPHRLNWPP